MKILFASEYFPPFAPGGGQWNALGLARALVARGHEAAVVTPNYGAADSETIDGVQVLRFPFPKKMPPGQGSVLRRWHANPLFARQFAWELYRFGRRMRPDVVFACLKYSMFPVLLAGRALGAACLVEVRDPGYGCPINTCLIEGPDIPKDCGQAKLWRHRSEFYCDHYGKGGWRKRLRTKAVLAFLFSERQIRLRSLRWFQGIFFVSQGPLDI